MVYDYIISLKSTDSRTTDVISQILYLIAFSYFTIFAFYPFLNKVYLVAAAALLLCWVWLLVKRKKTKKVYFTSGLAIAAITFCTGVHANWWVGILYAFAALAEREFKFPKEIGFSNDEITVNSLIKKRYSWNEVKHTMIKEGILTIDLKNNKLIQKEIAEDVPGDTEAEFNEFCSRRVLGV